MSQKGTTFVVHPENKTEKFQFGRLRSSKHEPHHLTQFHEYMQMGGTEVLRATAINKKTFVATSNGFVDAVIKAYNRHHNLVIRPDDVWLAIVLQFSRYLNANGEELRSKFVAHSGQKELVISDVGSLRTKNYGHLAKRMAQLMREHVKDTQVCDWIEPSFSTTTNNDRIVGSVALMTVMQKYFAYKMGLCCGIPKITILGTVEDWKDIQQRVKKLAEYGPECTEWSKMLGGILEEFVKTVTGPVDDIDLDFWKRICHYRRGGSGPCYISGWLSAFAVFSEEGEWQGDKFSMPYRGEQIVTDYPIIEDNQIPAGYATVDVLVDDNGTDYKCAMFVGHTGFNVIESRTTLAPQLTWGIIVKGECPTPPAVDPSGGSKLKPQSVSILRKIVCRFQKIRGKNDSIAGKR